MRILTAVTLVLSVVCTHADNSSERLIKGKLIAITGGAGDICSAIAKKFLEHGAEAVVLVDIDKERGEEVKKRLIDEFGEGKADFVYADVVNDLDKVIEVDVPIYGLADVLVNCAGILNEYDHRSVMETNALATMEWTDKMYELSRVDRGGKGSTIINVSGMYAYVVDPFIPGYTANMAAIMAHSMAKGHEMNYRHSKVRIICILPGFTETRMTARQMEVDEKHEDFTKYSKSWKWQTAVELADAFIEVFENAVSGSAHTIDGGKHYEIPPIDYRSAEDIDNALNQK